MAKINPNPGTRLREAMRREQPLQVAGTPNAFCALMAKDSGFKALYLSGAGVANISYGLPDLGITTLDNVLEDCRRITGSVDLPLLVDADTGFGGAFSLARTVRELERAGAAGMHIEDQVQQKRCGHRPGKRLVSVAEMTDRIKAAVDARAGSSFVIMARTDALADEGLHRALERAQAYKDAGADMIFPEAVASLDQYRAFTALALPVLANITEFGRSPLFERRELGEAGVSLILYPLTAARAMHKAAQEMYGLLRQAGTQKDGLAKMQTRDELYRLLDYSAYERKLDALFGNDASGNAKK